MLIMNTKFFQIFFLPSALVFTPLFPNLPASAQAANYGADTCVQGYVWRGAISKDHVCVTPETRSQTAYDNSLVSVRRNPFGGPYGRNTCLQGYVWREAVPNDYVCVTPVTRSQAAYDNSQASVRRVCNLCNDVRLIPVNE